MNYKDIKDFHQRCKAHPDHQNGMISHAMIQMRLHEEVAELRHFIEWYLTPERNFCARCGKRSYPEAVHTCTPPQFDYVNNTAA